MLSFEKVSESEVDGPEYEHLEGVFGAAMRIARMRLGDEFIELTEFLAPRGPAGAGGFTQQRSLVPARRDHHQRHGRGVSVAARVTRCSIASSGPQRLPDWNKNAGGIRAFYFRDPDGHPLEVLGVSAGQGQREVASRIGQAVPRNRSHGDRDFRYRCQPAVLSRSCSGFQVAGESENYGPEQEHLNNVFRRAPAASRRCGRPAARASSSSNTWRPSDGRPYPPDEKPNDLVHWQTRVRAANTEQTLARLRQAGATLISSGLVELKSGRSTIVRDPDGHAVEIVE